MVDKHGLCLIHTIVDTAAKAERIIDRRRAGDVSVILNRKTGEVIFYESDNELYLYCRR